MQTKKRLIVVRKLKSKNDFNKTYFKNYSYRLSKCVDAWLKTPTFKQIK